SVVIGVLGLSYFFTNNKSENVQYITEKVVKGDIVNTVLATGSVSAYQKVSVGAQVSGQIDKLYVKLGQTIKKGDLIAEIDSTTQTNDLKTAKSNLEIYKAQLKSKTI
ncbi:biotin/lipoyl-binding protein, partial [Escherichia coli]|nr:biotin/lipoyl-binding protein [Escherichia coli]EJO9115058.1 biotin/lipoyl-binding protein [Escherichia coli]